MKSKISWTNRSICAKNKVPRWWRPYLFSSKMTVCNPWKSITNSTFKSVESKCVYFYENVSWYSTNYGRALCGINSDLRKRTISRNVCVCVNMWIFPFHCVCMHIELLWCSLSFVSYSRPNTTLLKILFEEDSFMRVHLLSHHSTTQMSQHFYVGRSH